jgi:hypothetical protein
MKILFLEPTRNDHSCKFKMKLPIGSGEELSMA